MISTPPGEPAASALDTCWRARADEARLDHAPQNVPVASPCGYEDRRERCRDATFLYRHPRDVSSSATPAMLAGMQSRATGPRRHHSFCSSAVLECAVGAWAKARKPNSPTSARESMSPVCGKELCRKSGVTAGRDRHSERWRNWQTQPSKGFHRPCGPGRQIQEEPAETGGPWALQVRLLPSPVTQTAPEGQGDRR